MEIARRSLGARHVETLSAIRNLGSLLHEAGDLEGAATLFSEALEGSRETLGNDHADTLVSMNNLGGLYQERGDNEGAKVLYVEALRARSIGLTRAGCDEMRGTRGRHSRVTPSHG